MIGTKAPDFSLDSSEGNKFTSEEMAGNWYVLLFYAKDGSPTCKRGCLSFKEQYNLFKSLDPPVEIVGISQDTAEDHKKFKEEHQLSFDLLSDTSGKVCKQYDALMPIVKVPKRITYLIDAEQRVRAVYSDMFGATKHIKSMINQLKTE